MPRNREKMIENFCEKHPLTQYQRVEVISLLLQVP